VIIRLDGQVEKRKKKLSKAVYGTSHTSQHGRVALSQEAAAYFARHRCQVELLPTTDGTATASSSTP
jgi:hypothetical protein